jgi:hypothetical protein
MRHDEIGLVVRTFLYAIDDGRRRESDPVAVVGTVTTFVNGKPIAAKSVSAKPLAHTMTGLSSEIGYTFKVAAVNAVGRVETPRRRRR